MSAGPFEGRAKFGSCREVKWFAQRHSFLKTAQDFYLSTSTLQRDYINKDTEHLFLAYDHFIVIM